MASANLALYGNPHAALVGVLANASGITVTLGSTDLGTQYNAIGMSWVPIATDTITALGYHQGTTTGTPAGGSYSIAIFPLTTGGLINSGATFGNATSGGVTITTFTPAAADDNKQVWVSLGANTYSVTQGQEYGIAMWRNAATDASNKITANPNIANTYRAGFPVSQTCAAGTWTKAAATSSVPVLSLQSASNTYGYPFTGTTLSTNRTFGSTTEIGTSFTIPSNWGSSYKLLGIRGALKMPATSATNTLQANLYSSPTSSPVQIAKTPLIFNDRPQVPNGTGFSELWFQGTLPTLTPGTEYGLGFSTTTAADGGIYTLDMLAAADFNAWSYQQQLAFITRTASSFANIDAGTATGNFSKTTTRRWWGDLIFSDITAAGGSGMLYIPDMAGT